MKLNWLKYILLISFFAFLFFSLGFYFKIHETINYRLLPIKTCTYTIQKNLDKSHLWLEEYLSSDSTIDIIKDVTEPLEIAEKHAFALINGQAELNHIKIIPFADSIYTNHTKEILKNVIAIKELSTYRIDNKSVSNIGTVVDQNYDLLSMELDQNIALLDKEIDKRLADEYHKNRHTKDGLIRLSAILGGFVLLFLFISDRKKTKTNIENNKQKSEMALILNEAPIGIFHFDKDYIITDCNPKLAEIVGSPMEKIIGVNILTQIEDGRIGEACKETFAKGHAYYEDIYKSTLANKATPVIIEFKALKNEVGQYYSGIGLMRDMSAEYKAKQELKESEEKFRSISDMANDMIIMMDDKGMIEYWNHSAENILGYSRDEIIGKNLHNIIAPKRYHEAHHIAFADWVKTGKGNAIGKTVELSAIHKEGHEVFIDLSLSSIKISEAWHAIGIIRDVTERKKYETELIEAKEKAEESDRLKTAFLSNISHEIRTPMNGIIGFADLLKDPNVKGDQLKYFIEIIETSSQRMLNIINDIVVVSKIDAGDIECHKTKVDISEIIEGIVAKLEPEAQNKDISLNFHSSLNKQHKTILTDYEKLNHVILSILKNAIKFTHKGGVDCSLSHDNNRFIIEVKDSGIGIPADMQKVIFDRFRQADSSKNRMYEGAGLGLSISKAYIDILEGEILLDSTEGVGSKFTIILPQEEFEEETIIEPFETITNNQKLTILIAEDEYPSFVLLNEYLSYLDADIVHAQDGLEALSFVKNNHVDLILMDLKMPNMDGYKAIPLIKAEKPNIPIIAQTAYAMSGDEEKAIKIGSDDYIRKPIDERVLKTKVKRHLRI